MPGETPTLAVVGLGLIGGSLVKAVKERKLPYRVIGVARREETRRQALECGAVDEIFASPAEAAPHADLVVLALPVLTIASALGEMSPLLAPLSVVTDVGSTKGDLVSRIEKELPPGISFVGGHPIAGTEDSGFEASFSTLFEEARCILTPGPSSTPAAVDAVSRLWSGVGSRVEVMSVEAHDRILAVISHLPHVVAYALVNAAGEYEKEHPGLLDYTGGGFLDFTRIAASHPEMWRDICLDNRTEVLGAVDRFIDEMTHLRHLIAEGDGDGIVDAFSSARKVRRALSLSSHRGRS